MCRMESPGNLDAHRVAGRVPSDADVDLYRRLSADIAAGVAVVSTALRNRDYAATVTGFLAFLFVSLRGERRAARQAADRRAPGEDARFANRS